MVISRDARKAMDHARGARATLGFVLCELDNEEGETWEAKINRSVVTVRLLIRAPYCGITANGTMMMSKGHAKESRSNHQKRALLAHPWHPCETGTCTALHIVRMPWSLYDPGTGDFHLRTPRFEGKPGQI